MRAQRSVFLLVVAVAVTASACGSDVAEYRSRQIALQHQIADLERVIASFSQMHEDSPSLMPFVRVAADPELFAASFKKGVTLDEQIEDFAQMTAAQMRLRQLKTEASLLAAGRPLPEKPAASMDWLSLVRPQIKEAIANVKSLREARDELRDVEQRIAALGEKP